MSAPSTPLPLPVARLRRRSHNAKSPKDRHDAAYFAWEVSLRLGVAAAPPADPSTLARASVGQWASALRVAELPLADPRVLALFARLTEIGTDKRSERRSITARELMNALPAYRNRTIGHGSARAPSYYEEAGAELLAALDAAWEAGVFLPRDTRMVFAETIQVGRDGEPRARLLALEGEAPTVVDPRGTVVPRELLPHGLYLRREERWTPLHPWLLFDEESERVLCFNGLARRAEYLDYASGETLAGPELERVFPGITDELRGLFGASSGGGEAVPASSGAIEDARFFGDYEVLGKLGQGGMGAVYLARQKSLERLVALKMLPAERAHDAIAVARFKREIEALSRCEHANVIKILARGEARGTHYYAMEYVEGADLARVARALSSSSDFDTAISSACEAVRGERKELFEGVPQVERRARVPERGRDRYQQAARFFAEAARGVAHLHANGILHRDISPANLMVTWPDERAVVMDLGLAGVENASVTLTKDDRQILGTLRYIAPEQLQRSLLAVDKRADVYSLGVSLYELLADRPMWDGETEAQLIQQVIREEPPPLDRVAPNVPRDLALIVAKACEKDPKLRYETADALADDLERFLSGKPVTARPPTLGYLLSRWVAKHKELAAASGLAVLLLAGTVTWTIVRLREKNAELERRKREVLEQSALNEAELLLEEQTRLWPLFDGAVLERSEAWAARARALGVGTPERVGLDGFRARLAELRRRGRELTAEEKRQRSDRDERFQRVERAERHLALLRLVRQRRSSSGALAPKESGARPDWSRLPADWEGLNRRAWEMVDWIDRRDETDDALALEVARRALELVRAADGGEKEWMVLDTLAWASFRNGLDDEARELSERALEQVPKDEFEHVEDSKLRLEEELDAAVTEVGRKALEASIARAEDEFDLARAGVAGISDWSFSSPADQLQHDYLARLVARMEDVFAKLESPGGAASAGTLSVESRIAWTRTAFAWLEDPRIRARWDDARRFVAADEQRYAGLDLRPIAGLIPVGKHPRTGLFEFYLPIAPASADFVLPSSTDRPSAEGLVFVLVPGGTFVQGMQSVDPTSDSFGRPSETEDPPQPDEFRADGQPIEVALAPYLLSKFETTQAQWKRLMSSNPSLLREGQTKAGVTIGPDHPVNNVSWRAATTLVRRLGATLPTEAQWERAALAGESWAELTEADLPRFQERANTADASMRRTKELAGLESIVDAIDDGHPVHSPVGALAPNAWGFHDLQGNVWEWCRDWYGVYDEPLEPETGERHPYPTTHRVLRGGGAFESWTEARIPRRNHDGPSYASLSTGLRVAIELAGSRR